MDGNAEDTPKKYLMVSDFDQTLSFNDSGIVLSELLGVSGFTERINGLSTIHLVQQGGELAYLLLHDPEYRRVRREHLVEVGKRIRLKQNIRSLSKLLASIEGYSFHSTWSPPLRGKRSNPHSKARFRQIIFSALNSVMTRRPGRSNRSCGCRPVMERWPWSTRYAPACSSVMTGSCM